MTRLRGIDQAGSEICDWCGDMRTMERDAEADSFERSRAGWHTVETGAELCPACVKHRKQAIVRAREERVEAGRRRMEVARVQGKR